MAKLSYYFILNSVLLVQIRALYKVYMNVKSVNLAKVARLEKYRVPYHDICLVLSYSC